MDCGPVNPLSQLKQQIDQESFPDSFRGPQHGFRSAQPSASVIRQQDFAEEFLRTGGAPPATASSSSALLSHYSDPSFVFHDLREQVEQLEPSQTGTGTGTFVDNPIPVTADWHAEFTHFQSQADPSHLFPSELDHFDQAFRNAREAHQGQVIPWTSEFQQFQHTRLPPVHLSADETAVLDKAFEDARTAHGLEPSVKSWANEFAEREQAVANDWVHEFNGDKTELSETAGELLNAVRDKLTDPKFSNSEFIKFMAQLRDKEVSIEGDKIVENISSTVKDRDWASEFAQRSDDYVESMWAKEFGNQFMGDEKDWAEDFDIGTGLEQNLGENSATSWANEFDRLTKGDPALRTWNANLPEYEQYQFEPLNPFVHESLDTLQSLPIDSMPLADAILALEARVTQNPEDARAWSLLGIKQQENEHERQAISALRQAINHDLTLLDSWLALAVSYTNENHPEPAYDSLRHWIRHNPNYSTIESQINPTNDSFQDVSRMFLEATLLNREILDADVQVGLGVLFNVSEEYDKAVDCFQAALAVRPNDYLLWNKLGATLANSHDATRAMDAYFHALEINPNYIRARYNLAIACINLGQHREAAHHLIEALTLQLGAPEGTMDGTPSVTSGFMSSNVWDTLRMACLLMNKAEWATMCDERDLNLLRQVFDQAD